MALNELVVLKRCLWKYGFNLLRRSQAGNRIFDVK